MNCGLPDVQAGFRKGRGTRDQIGNILWIMEKSRAFQKNTYFCFIDYAKAFDCLDHNKLWKILKEVGIPDHLTCLLTYIPSKEQASLNFMAAVTIYSDFGAQENKACFHCFPMKHGENICHELADEVMGPDALILDF